MLKFLMRNFLLSSPLLLLTACSSYYADLQSTQSTIQVSQLIPQFKSEWYRTEIDVTGRHLSGLLLIKTMVDSSARIIFTNEMGLQFFDFEFGKNGEFSVKHIVEKMNKAPVIKTLKKDFGLILMPFVLNTIPLIYKNGTSTYLQYKYNGDEIYLISENGISLDRSELSTGRKPKIVAQFTDFVEGVPDSINVNHLKFPFTISLKHLSR